jgi:5-methyltetrahydrofolate--homocysteine methyltransferase
MTARERLEELLQRRIVVLDGAWGTMLQGRGLDAADFHGERFRDHSHDLAGDPDVLNLTRPDVVLEVHRAYL